MDDEIRQNKISGATAFLMVAVAVFFDLIQIILEFIPIVGFILNKLISIFASLTFWLWLTLKGVKSNRQWILGGSFVIEIFPIPFLSALPVFTGGIIAIILKERIRSVTKEIV